MARERGRKKKKREEEEEREGHVGERERAQLSDWPMGKLKRGGMRRGATYWPRWITLIHIFSKITPVQIILQFNPSRYF